MSAPAQGRLARWLGRLEQLDPNKIDLGLDRVAAVLPRLGIQQPPLTLTVAGTNGKGTSVAMLSHLLRATGTDVGCYTSPHLSRFNERVQINGEAVSDDALVAAFDVIESARHDEHLTYFEFTTLAAMLIFSQNRVAVQLLEVGLGGRLDAVNVIDPDACLLTNVALDHQRWLGNTVEAIGAEKAAIFRANKPAIIATADPPASVLRVASDIGAVMHQMDKDYWLDIPVGNSRTTWQWRGAERTLKALPWLDAAQAANAGGVFAILESVGLLSELTDAQCSAAAMARPAGRLEALSGPPTLLLDVCHNEASVARLAAHLDAQSMPQGGRTLVFGAMRDKAIAAMLAPLRPYFTRWIAVAASGSRATPAVALARQMTAATGMPALAAGSPWHGMQYAMRLTAPSGEIVVAGSFPVVGAIRSRL